MTDAADRHRPRIHFVPPQHWINDPNGLVRVRDGWRVYFQYADDVPAYRRVHWGTATSADLLRWDFDGIAIAGTEQVSAYSGCVQIEARTPAPALTAYFTAHRLLADGTRRQTQERRTSTDGGRTFAAAERSPLIDAGLANFRDPFVCVHADGTRSMLVAVPADWNASARDPASRLAVYRDAGDGDWRPHGTIGPWDPPQVLWEVPWLLELRRDDGELRSVLVISIVDRRQGAVRSSVRYWVGRFDGREFVPEADAAGLPLDHGPDYYAAIPATPASPHDPLTIAWVGNWAYARALRVSSWAGGPLSLPQHLTLHRTERGSRLRRTAIPLEALHGAATRSRSVVSAARARLARLAPPCTLTLRVELGTATAVTLALFGAALEITLDAAGEQLTFVRAPAPGCPEAFAGRWIAQRERASRALELYVVVDTCTVEAFADEGAIAFTLLLFPDGSDADLTASAVGGEALVAVDCRQLAVASPAPAP